MITAKEVSLCKIKLKQQKKSEETSTKMNLECFVVNLDLVKKKPSPLQN